VAFLVGDEGILSELREFSEFAWSDQSSLQIRVALHCLEDGDHVERIRGVFRKRLRRLSETLGDLGFEPYPAGSGMYAVCRVPSTIAGQAVASAHEAADVLLSEHGVAVVPWEIEPQAYLRFSAQYREDDLEALTTLGRNGKLVSR